MGFPVKAGIKWTGDKQVDRLLGQLEYLCRSSHVGWSKSRKVRFHQFKAFLKFAAGRSGLKNIREIKPSDVKEYVLWRQRQGIREKTILAELSTIRFWHKQIPLRKYNLPPNSVLLGEDELRDRSWKRR